MKATRKVRHFTRSGFWRDLPATRQRKNYRVRVAVKSGSRPLSNIEDSFRDQEQPPFFLAPKAGSAYFYLSIVCDPVVSPDGSFWVRITVIARVGLSESSVTLKKKNWVITHNTPGSFLWTFLVIAYWFVPFCTFSYNIKGIVLLFTTTIAFA